MLSQSRLLAFCSKGAATAAKRWMNQSVRCMCGSSFLNASIGCGLVVFGFIAQVGYCQEKVSRSILVIEEAASPSDLRMQPAADSERSVPVKELGWSGSAPLRLTSSDKSDSSIEEPASSLEVVRDRFPNGKLSVERHVVLDVGGNYVNQGVYRQFNDKGDLLIDGRYEQGQRTGAWTRFLSGTESPLFKSYPYNKFRAPFASTVEFEADKMQGVWVIRDLDKRIVSQIELDSSQRHGAATLYHPNGQVYSQSHFVHGILDGLSIEKSVDGKLTRQDTFVAGRKQIVDTEHFPNKSIKSVTRYLSGVHAVEQPDNWNTTTLASIKPNGDKQLHGEFVTYHDNGQLATKGSYQHGQLHGPFESWHRTGEIAARGAYHSGEQDGDWVWRHANGMKRAIASYDKGQLRGEQGAWDERGKLTSTK